MGRVAAAGDGADDESAALRAKLEDAERRLNSTALELRAALAKIHHGRANSSSPPGSPARVGRSCPCGHEGTTCAQRRRVLLALVRAGVHGPRRRRGVLPRRGPAAQRLPPGRRAFRKAAGREAREYREGGAPRMFLGALGVPLVRWPLRNRLGVTLERAALTAARPRGSARCFETTQRRLRRIPAAAGAVRAAQRAGRRREARGSSGRTRRRDSRGWLAMQKAWARSRSIGGNVRSAETNPKSLRGALETFRPAAATCSVQGSPHKGDVRSRGCYEPTSGF